MNTLYSSTPPRLYAELQDVVLSTMQRTGATHGFWPYRTGAM
jgi:hypothetical protein